MFQYILPGFFGIFIAFGLVSMSHTGDMRGLMASVSEIAQPQYDADIVMERKGDTLTLIMGKEAQKVDTVSFRLLSNPADGIVFVPSIGTIIDETEGSYLFVRSYSSEDLSIGTVIVSFSGIPQDAPVAITDTEFVSWWVRYSMRVKGNDHEAESVETKSLPHMLALWLENLFIEENEEVEVQNNTEANIQLP